MLGSTGCTALAHREGHPVAIGVAGVKPDRATVPPSGTLTCCGFATGVRFSMMGTNPLRTAASWDVPSALAYLAEGFTAIGTTSFGVSSSGGHPDGHRATRGANIALAAALAPLQCYVSVDIEDGYSDDGTWRADLALHQSTYTNHSVAELPDRRQPNTV